MPNLLISFIIWFTTLPIVLGQLRGICLINNEYCNNYLCTNNSLVDIKKYFTISDIGININCSSNIIIINFTKSCYSDDYNYYNSLILPFIGFHKTLEEDEIGTSMYMISYICPNIEKLQEINLDFYGCVYNNDVPFCTMNIYQDIDLSKYLRKVYMKNSNSTSNSLLIKISRKQMDNELSSLNQPQQYNNITDPGSITNIEPPEPTVVSEEVTEPTIVPNQFIQNHEGKILKSYKPSVLSILLKTFLIIGCIIITIILMVEVWKILKKLIKIN